MLSSFSLRGSISGSSTALTRRRLLVAVILAKRLGLETEHITKQNLLFYS